MGLPIGDASGRLRSSWRRSRLKKTLHESREEARELALLGS